MNKILPTIYFLVAILAAGSNTYAQQTTTNYCPDTESNIRLELIQTFNDSTKRITR